MPDSTKTVVIADDEAHVRLYLKALVKTLDLTVVGEARNGVEAAALVREKRPSLVLLDVNMPVRTGAEALEDILGEWAEARVVMLSSMADRQCVEQCLAMGATHFIRKDCAPGEIRALLAELLTEGGPA